MKKIALLGMLLLAFGANANSRPPHFWKESQALSRTAITGTTRGTDNESDPMGLDLSQIRGLRVSICANSGQTLSGAGNLRVVLFHADESVWMRAPTLDMAVTASGARCQVWDLQTVVFRGDIVAAYTDSVTVSGGTTVSVRIDGQYDYGQGGL